MHEVLQINAPAAGLGVCAVEFTMARATRMLKPQRHADQRTSAWPGLRRRLRPVAELAGTFFERVLGLAVALLPLARDALRATSGLYFLAVDELAGVLASRADHLLVSRR